MKRAILSLLAAIAMGSAMLSAQTVTNDENGRYSLKTGNITMTERAGLHSATKDFSS